MILLDPSVISEAMKPQPNTDVLAWLNDQVSETLYMSSVTLSELLFGIAAITVGKRNDMLAQALDGLMELFGDRVLPFDTDAARHYDDSINAQSTVDLLQQIEQQHPCAKRIHIICDNAHYYRSRVVTEYLLNSKIELIFLPPYAPNLNLIERYWRFFKKEILYGKYYETFALFKQACNEFFAAPERYRKELSSLLIDNFQIIGCARSAEI